MVGDSPLVSVIIPCWNQARFLAECVGSLQGQSYHNWEAVIVNDGSPDDARERGLGLCRRDSRVRYIEQANGGLSSARNRGVAAAQGAYFQFLDADDLLEAHKLSTQIQELERQPEIGIVFGDARYFPEDRPAAREAGPYALGDGKPWIGALWERSGDLLGTLARRNIMAVHCPLLRRRVVELVGPWSERLVALEDWEYWLRCAAAGVGFRYRDAPQTLALVRMHPRSLTRDSDRMKRAAVAFRIEAACSFERRRDLLLYNARAALRSGARLGRDDRRQRYKDIYLAHRDPGARFLIAVSFLFGAHSILGRFVPWRVSNFFAQRFLC